MSQKLNEKGRRRRNEETQREIERKVRKGGVGKLTRVVLDEVVEGADHVCFLYRLHGHAILKGCLCMSERRKTRTQTHIHTKTHPHKHTSTQTHLQRKLEEGVRGKDFVLDVRQPIILLFCLLLLATLSFLIAEVFVFLVFALLLSSQVRSGDAAGAVRTLDDLIEGLWKELREGKKEGKDCGSLMKDIGSHIHTHSLSLSTHLSHQNHLR